MTARSLPRRSAPVGSGPSAPDARGRRRLRAGTALLAGTGLLLAACSGEDGAGSADGASAGEGTAVVTSTSVYADLVAQVAGEGVEVKALIDSTAQDPHSYEATAQDRLAVEKADLVVLNGGGYDTFMEGLAQEAGVPVISAVEAAGLEESAEPSGEQSLAGADEHTDHEDHDHAGHDHSDHDHGDGNEHVWYDLEAMSVLVGKIADGLTEAAPEGGAGFRDRADTVSAEIDALAEKAHGVHGDDRAYVATEPVADHLLEEVGLHDDTPVEFTAAVENGTDVPPLVLRKTLDLLADDHVAVLAYNAQTGTGQTEQVRETARKNGVAVLEFTETLPEGKNYQQWMQENIEALSEVLN